MQKLLVLLTTVFLMAAPVVQSAKLPQSSVARQANTVKGLKSGGTRATPQLSPQKHYLCQITFLNKHLVQATREWHR